MGSHGRIIILFAREKQYHVVKRCNPTRNGRDLKNNIIPMYL